MAVLKNSDPTLLDVANMPGNEGVRDIVDLMAQFNPILQDAPAFECNKGTYHETTVRTGLPEPVWGRLYKGIPSSKGTRQQVKDTTGFLEAASEVDTRLVDVLEKAMDKASIRFEEAQGHLEAMSQEAARALFYHDTNVDPDKPMGFAPRFSSLSAENGKQIIDGGGLAANNTSVWMLTWDKKSNHLIYPKSGRAGIERVDRGAVPTIDAEGNRYFVYREEFTWHMGLTVRDWRYVSRGCNIDVSDLSIDASAGVNLIELMTEMYYRHYGRRVSMGKTCMYANTEVVKYLDYQARNAVKNLFLTFEKAGPNAEEVLTFRGVPIRETDAIMSTEARVV